MTKEFQMALEQELAARGIEGELRVTTVNKNNGVTYEAFTVLTGETSFGPQIPVVEGIPVDELVNKYEQVMANLQDEFQDQEGLIENLQDKDWVLDHLSACLLKMDMNEAICASHPFETVMDLAVIPVVCIQDEGTAKISWNQMNALGISEKELIQRMWENVKAETVSISSLGQMLGLPDDAIPIDTVPMFVVRTSGIFGAAALLRPDAFARLADALEDDIVILPSSVYEVLAIPASNMDRESMADMIQQVNRDQVRETDVLSDHAYIYERETGVIRAM